MRVLYWPLAPANLAVRKQAIATGSAGVPTADIQCQDRRGFCFPGFCREPWYSIGRCHIAMHHCCKRCERNSNSRKISMVISFIHTHTHTHTHIHWCL
uniref:Uncharacterized protein n=1 Tax=Salvator merianae TaxID=96440 RepID=A0A8D0BXI4_SALMN